MSTQQPVTQSAAPGAATAPSSPLKKRWVIATALVVGAAASSVGSYAFSQTEAGQAAERSIDQLTATVDGWFESVNDGIDNLLP